MAVASPTGRRSPATNALLSLRLDRSDGAPPLYRQIRDGVRAAVLRGSAGAGTRLPPERELADALGVNRSTIMRAYSELAADGLVEARPGRGTVILAGNSATPDERPREQQAGSAWLLGLPPYGNGNLGPEPGLLRDLSALGARPDVIQFATGVPGIDLLPLDALQAALARALARTGASALGYGPVEGMEELRSAIAARLTMRGAATEPEEVLVLSGATQGIGLAAHALIEPGDEVVVEAPTYMGVLQAFGAAGARLIGVPVDTHGMRVEVLAPLLARRRVRLIVVQPTLHNPTNATLSIERRVRLVDLARRHGIPILEDDAYGELWRDASGPPALKSLDTTGLVMHVGTFSKTVAPGLRVGWLAAPSPVIGRLVLAKQLADLHTASLSQLLLAEFIVSGAYDRHLTWVRGVYEERRAAMREGLIGVQNLRIVSGADGGFYFWVALPPGQQARLLAAAAGRADVALVAGEVFYPRDVLGTEDGRDRIRLSCAFHTPAIIAEGLRRLAPLLHAEPSHRGAASGMRPLV